MSDDTHIACGVREGDVLAGKYRIEKILGAGGMGVVVAAYHVQLDQKVALKFLLPETLGNREAVARFAREARAAVKIRSEHVARVSDVGTLENGAPYMVMEYLDGADLSARLVKKGPLPVEQAVEFVLQACEALAEAHTIGIVHRDLKPANLFVIRRPDGVESVKVLDFGISKVTQMGGSGADSSMTKTSALMGSPLYMSPEQMQSSKDADARSDIWALGVILYELVTAALPFNGETMPELVLQIMSAAPRPMTSVRRDLPEQLSIVVGKCLAKNRADRYQTIADFAVALLPFAPKRARISVERISGMMATAGLSAGALPLHAAGDEKTMQITASTAASWGSTAPGDRHGRAKLGVLAAGVIAALVSAIVLVKGRSTPTPAPETVAASSSVPKTNAPKDETPPPAVSPVTVTSAAAVPSAPEPAPMATPVDTGETTKPGNKPLRASVPARKPIAAPPAKAPAPSVAAAPAPPQAAKVNVFDDRK